MSIARVQLRASNTALSSGGAADGFVQQEADDGDSGGHNDAGDDGESGGGGEPAGSHRLADPGVERSEEDREGKDQTMAGRKGTAIR